MITKKEKVALLRAAARGELSYHPSYWFLDGKP